MAATVATCCPSRVVEHPKSKSTQPRFARRSATLYPLLLQMPGSCTHKKPFVSAIPTHFPPESSDAKASELWSASFLCRRPPKISAMTASHTYVLKNESTTYSHLPTCFDILLHKQLQYQIIQDGFSNPVFFCVHSPASEKARASTMGQRKSAQQSPVAEKNMET